MNFTQFVDRFPGKYKRVYFFSGNSFFMNEAVTMVRQHVDPNLDFDFLRLESPKEGTVIDSLRIDAVDQNRLIIVNDPVGFEKWKDIVPWIHKINRDSSIIFTTSLKEGEDFDTKNELVQEVIRKGFYVVCRELDEYEGELHEWVAKELEPADAGAVDALIQHVGSNYSRIRLESEKLRLVTERTLNAQTVTKLLGTAEPRDVFDLMEAIGTGDKTKALESCMKIEEKSSGLGLIGLLEWRFRQLVIMHFLMSRGVEGRDILVRMKVHRFYAGQLFRLQKVFSMGRCRVALKLLSDSDRRLRRGENFHTVISMFIVRLMNAV